MDFPVLQTSGSFSREIAKQKGNSNRVIIYTTWKNANVFNLYVLWLYKRVLYSEAGLKAKENQSDNSSPKPKPTQQDYEMVGGDRSIGAQHRSC
jgi:hypothetical protein